METGCCHPALCVARPTVIDPSQNRHAVTYPTDPDDPYRQPRFTPSTTAPPPPTAVWPAAPPSPPPRRESHWIRNGLLVAVTFAVVLGGVFALVHSRLDSGTGSGPTAAAAPAEPGTAAGVRSAAVAYFGFYAAGQYAITYGLMSPGARAAIPEATWIGAHEACVNHSSQLAYSVTQPVLSGSTAVVNVAIAGALSKLGSEEASFTYSAGRWWYSPPNVATYQGHSTAQAVAALKASGQCT